MKLNRKPIIGIVSKHLSKDETRPNMFVRDEIKQAIFDNGGIAIGIILPKNEKIDENHNKIFEEFIKVCKKIKNEANN